MPSYTYIWVDNKHTTYCKHSSDETIFKLGYFLHRIKIKTKNQGTPKLAHEYVSMEECCSPVMKETEEDFNFGKLGEVSKQFFVEKEK